MILGDVSTYPIYPPPQGCIYLSDLSSPRDGSTYPIYPPQGMGLLIRSIISQGCIYLSTYPPLIDVSIYPILLSGRCLLIHINYPTPPPQGCTEYLLYISIYPPSWMDPLIRLSAPKGCFTYPSILPPGLYLFIHLSVPQ
jgi:hypothetical protein